MPWQSTIRSFACLLVLAAHTHCIVDHGEELRREIETSECAESPIQESESCENESGCICKGATLGEKLDTSLVQDDIVAWMLLSRVDLFACIVPLTNQGCGYCPAPPPPLGGVAARALLQSFQI